MTSEIILAWGTFITGVLAALGAFLSARKSARRDELELLRGELARLYERVEITEKKLDEANARASILAIDNANLRAENVILKARVEELESEMQQLKSARV